MTNTATRLVVRVGLLVCATLLAISPMQGQTRRPVLEYCTGTWCQWCPCGHDIIRSSIQPNFPKAIIIGYHGPANSSSDPWTGFAGNGIISGLGFSSYPTGIVDRTSAPISRSSWYSAVANRASIPAPVSIRADRQFNTATRVLDISIDSRALAALSGQFRLTVLILEGKMVYAQTGNSSCAGGSGYIHNHVVRAIITGHLGDNLNDGTTWSNGDVITRTYQYTVPASWVTANCEIVAIVSRVGATLNTGEIQQAESWELLEPTSVPGETGSPEAFALEQNYPNPFNPSTTIHYTVGEQSIVQLKIFNTLGQEVRTLVSFEHPAGTYSVEWDGKSDLGEDVPSGMYLYTLTAGGFKESRKMTLVR